MARILRLIEWIGRGAFLAALFFFTVLCGVAQAASVKPMAVRQVKLGPISALTYYTVEKNGFCVVTTIQPDEDAEEDSDPLPVRFVVTLAAGQEAQVSVPCAAGAKAIVLKIARIGDAIEISLPNYRDTMVDR